MILWPSTTLLRRPVADKPPVEVEAWHVIRSTFVYERMVMEIGYAKPWEYVIESTS